MTDLEITKLCAEAMEISLEPELDNGKFRIPFRCDDEDPWYDPLHDDAQAMALVKKCDLNIECDYDGWIVCDYTGEVMKVKHVDLNRAICECVAKMQAAKSMSHR